jgi:hypothetical protein
VSIQDQLVRLAKKTLGDEIVKEMDDIKYNAYFTTVLVQ